MLIPHLAYELTTIPRPDDAPVKLARIQPRAGNTVEAPLMDHQLAACKVLMDERPAAFLMDLANDRDMTMRVALKVRYVTPAFDADWNVIGTRKKLVFWGPLRRPEFDYDAGVITCNAVGPSARTEKAFIVGGDVAINPGVTADGRGLMTLLGLAQNRPSHDALNWPSLGIIPGLDSSTESSTYITLRLWDQIWSEGLQNFASALILPDWELEPFETDPAAVAIGTLTDNVGGNAPANATTDFDLVSAYPGEVSNLRVGLWIDHPHPHGLKLQLVSPAGTIATLWDGPAFSPVGGADAFGQGATDPDLGFLALTGMALYGDADDPLVYPRVGQFAQPELGKVLTEDATGTWKLRVTDSSGSAATVNAWTLRFEDPLPAYARLNVSDKPDSANPPIAATFHSGFGKTNLRRCLLATEGGLLVTQDIEVPTEGDAVPRGNNTARGLYGTWQSCESSGQADSHDVLVAKADLNVGAHAYPPIEGSPLQPVQDIGQPRLPRPFYDYKPGGFLKVVAKRGYCRHRTVQRLTRLVLTDMGDGVGCDWDLVPNISGLADIADA